MMTNRGARGNLFAGLAAAALWAAGCGGGGGPTGEGSGEGAQGTGAPAPAEIRIGEYGSMTGSDATFGVSTHNGIDLAVKQLNEAGGVKGSKLRVTTYDDQGKQQEAATAVTKLVTQDKVVAILGEVASARSLAGGTVAQQHGVPMISPASTNPKVTELGDYIFRVCFLDDFQGEVMARFARDTLKLDRVAIFRDAKNAYSVGLSDFFKKSFEGAGGKVVADVSYGSGDSDFKSQLTTLRAAEPQAIFIPGYYTEVGNIAQQARGMGLSVPLLGGDGWDSAKLVEIGGPAVEGTYFSSHYSVNDTKPEVKSFVDAYKAAYGGEPDSNAALAYDAAKLLADAMGRAPSVTPQAIRDAIAATRDFPGVTGVITIDEKRNARKSAVVLKVEGGKFVVAETVNP